MPKSVIDVVIPTGGRFDMLEKCLQSIKKFATIPLTVTVVDDGSKKEVRANYKSLLSSDWFGESNVVKYVVKRHEQSEGFPNSCNDGAKQFSAPILVFLNDDTEMTEGFFDEIVRIMRDGNIGICGAKLLFPEDSTNPQRPAGKVQHVGIAFDVYANAIHPLMGWSPDNHKTCITRECLAVTGAALVVRRDIFRNLGGFDPLYGKGYWEDVDLCLKVRQMGYKIIVDTNLIAYHYAGASSSIDPTFSQSFSTNASLFRARWGKTGLLTFDGWTYG